MQDLSGWILILIGFLAGSILLPIVTSVAGNAITPYTTGLVRRKLDERSAKKEDEDRKFRERVEFFRANRDVYISTQAYGVMLLVPLVMLQIAALALQLASGSDVLVLGTFIPLLAVMFGLRNVGVLHNAVRQGFGDEAEHENDSDRRATDMDGADRTD